MPGFCLPPNNLNHLPHPQPWWDYLGRQDGEWGGDRDRDRDFGTMGLPHLPACYLPDRTGMENDRHQAGQRQRKEKTSSCICSNHPMPHCLLLYLMSLLYCVDIPYLIPASCLYVSSSL